MSKPIKWENFRITLPDEYNSKSMFTPQKDRQKLLVDIFSENIFCEYNKHSLEFFHEESKDNLIYGRLLLDKDVVLNSKDKHDPNVHSETLSD